MPNTLSGQPQQPELAEEYPALRLFGPPRWAEGKRIVVFAAERRFQLLALLAVHNGQWIARDQIAGLLWPDRANSDARRNLRKVIFRLRELRGLGALEVNEMGLRWQVTSDLQVFRVAINTGRFEQALSIYGGQLLEGLDDDGNDAWADWLSGERARLHQAWHDAALTALGQIAEPAARAELARRLLRSDPLDEAAVAALVRSELERGNGAQAQRVYRDYAARLAEELGVEPSGALRELVRVQAPAQPHLDVGQVVPAVAASFVGRRTEFAELAALFADAACRQVTLVGPGGIGKSALAREAMSRLANLFLDGMVWVELQDALALDEAVARLAAGLGVDMPNQRDPLAPVLAWLARRSVLVVFDNAEHLSGMSGLIDRLLASAPATRVLCTSRERLGNPAEVLVPLAGLAYPDEASRDLEAATAFDAVRLFELRARTAQSSFDLAAQLSSVIAIVEAVDGMPLAIELAASWVRLLPAAEIARDLHQMLDWLERDPRSEALPSRPEHASLRGVIDRTYALLAPSEREALAALSLFAGGFTRGAAQQVARASLPLLSSLVDKSLVRIEGGGRFGLHPVIASYAAERLAALPERAAEIRRKHAEYFARLLADLAPQARSDIRLLLSGVGVEYANARSAWDWAVAAQRVDLVDAMVQALWRYFENSGRFREGIAMLSPALRLPERGATASRAGARLRLGLAVLHVLVGDLADASELARRVIAAGEACGDLEAYVGCLSAAGSCEWHQGRHDAALAYDERALAVSRRHGDRHCLTLALGKIALSQHAAGRTDQAIENMREALAIANETGNIAFRAGILCNLGNILSQRRDWSSAQALLEQALQLCIDSGQAIAALFARQYLGVALLRMGRTDGARGQLAQAAARARDVGMTMFELACERELARVDIAELRFSAALDRLRRLLLQARDDARAVDKQRAINVYGELLAATGRAGEAAEVWRLLMQESGLDSAARTDIGARLAALSLPIQSPIDAPGGGSTIDHWVEHALAEAPIL